MTPSVTLYEQILANEPCIKTHFQPTSCGIAITGALDITCTCTTHVIYATNVHVAKDCLMSGHSLLQGTHMEKQFPLILQNGACFLENTCEIHTNDDF